MPAGEGHYVCAIFDDETHEHYHYECLPDELAVAWAFDLVRKW